MTFRITYSVVNADLTELHREFDGAVEDLVLWMESLRLDRQGRLRPVLRRAVRA
jgi:hypothetical protein